METLFTTIAEGFTGLEVVVLLLVEGVEVGIILLDASTMVVTILLIKLLDSLLGVTSVVESSVSFVAELTGFGTTTVVADSTLELVVTMVPTNDDLIEDDTTLDDVIVEAISLLDGEAEDSDVVEL